MRIKKLTIKSFGTVKVFNFEGEGLLIEDDESKKPVIRGSRKGQQRKVCLPDKKIVKKRGFSDSAEVQPKKKPKIGQKEGAMVSCSDVKNPPSKADSAAKAKNQKLVGQEQKGAPEKLKRMRESFSGRVMKSDDEPLMVEQGSLRKTSLQTCKSKQRIVTKHGFSVSAEIQPKKKLQTGRKEGATVSCFDVKNTPTPSKADPAAKAKKQKLVGQVQKTVLEKSNRMQESSAGQVRKSDGKKVAMGQSTLQKSSFETYPMVPRSDAKNPRSKADRVAMMKSRMQKLHGQVHKLDPVKTKQTRERLSIERERAAFRASLKKVCVGYQIHGDDLGKFFNPLCNGAVCSDANNPPSKADRAAMLLSRYADVITKAKKQKLVGQNAGIAKTKQTQESLLGQFLKNDGENLGMEQSTLQNPSLDAKNPSSKADRVAMLNTRYGDVIWKAQQQKLHSQVQKLDRVKTKQRGEKLSLEKERAAFRASLQKMEEEAVTNAENSVEIMEELKKLCGGSLSYRYGPVMERLRLFLKNDNDDDPEDQPVAISWNLGDDIEEGEIVEAYELEEGEICC